MVLTIFFSFEETSFRTKIFFFTVGPLQIYISWVKIRDIIRTTFRNSELFSYVGIKLAALDTIDRYIVSVLYVMLYRWYLHSK